MPTSTSNSLVPRIAISHSLPTTSSSTPTKSNLNPPFPSSLYTSTYPPPFFHTHTYTSNPLKTTHTPPTPASALQAYQSCPTPTYRSAISNSRRRPRRCRHRHLRRHGCRCHRERADAQCWGGEQCIGGGIYVQGGTYGCESSGRG
jgi:hypothetical protein